jgi:4-aminobutyrate aminotransferase-like enzyme
MPVPQADTLVEQAVLEMLSSPDFAERRRRLVGTEPDAQGAIDELTRVKAQMQELATQYGAGTFTMVEWVEARRGLEGRLEAAERAMEAARRGAVAMLEVVSSDDLVEDWSELPIERRRAVIRTLIERVEIHPHRGGRKPDPERLRPVWRA